MGTRKVDLRYMNMDIIAKRIVEKIRNENELKIPQINFIPLKKGITDNELNEYMINSDDTNFLIYLRCKYETDKEWEYLVEAATFGFDDGIIWLNDWDE